MHYKPSRPLLALIIFTIFGVTSCFPSFGADLVIQTFQNVTLNTGTYYYDSVTIHGEGRLHIRGNVVLNVTGDVVVLREDTIELRNDPGAIMVDSPGRPSDGSAGTAGTPGANGPVGGVRSGQSGGSGGDGGDGSDAGVQGPYNLTINSGGDIRSDGVIDFWQFPDGAN